MTAIDTHPAPTGESRRPAQADDFDPLAQSFRRSLLAANRGPRTVSGYSDSVRLFGEFLARAGMPRRVAHIRREHVEAFVAEQLALEARHRPHALPQPACLLRLARRGGRDRGDPDAAHEAAQHPRGSP